MLDKLRRRYQVHKEVARNGYFEGRVALRDLRRLLDLLPGQAANEGREITLGFEFIRSEYEIPKIRGRLETSLELECQRCLGALEMPIALDFDLVVDASDELLRDIGMDSLYSADGYVDVFELVEDELILAVPLVAMHENTACNEHWQAAAQDAATAEKENPFAVLAQLKTTEQS